MRLSFAIAVCLFGLLGTARAADDDKLRLESGEAVVRIKGTGKLREAQVAGLFTSAPEKIWALVNDCNKFTKTMLRIKEAKELSREGGKIRCKTTLSMPWPLDDLHATTEAVHTVVPGKKWQRKWTTIEGDFVVNQGSWTITPYSDGQRTLVVYKAKVQPKADIPDEIRTMAQKNELPKLFRHFKDQLGEP